MTVAISARAQAYRAPQIFPALPPGWQRDPYVQVVERVAPRLGLGRAAAHTFTRLAAMTRPGDWTADDREPFVYAAASEIAKIIGLSEARLRAHTAELVGAGLIERRTAANGSRSLYAGTGLFFTPAIERLDELVELDERMEGERRHSMYLRGQRSTHRRCLTEALGLLRQLAPGDPQVEQIESAFASWPRADRLHRMTLTELQQHEAAADSLCRSALDLLENLEESDGRPLDSERPYIQDTTQESVVCNAHVDKWRAGKPAHDNCSGPPPTGGEQDAEKQRGGEGGLVKSEWIAKIGPERLFRLASSEMQLYLSGRASPDRLRFHDFIWTAERRLPELGIHPSAWAEACEAMGQEAATIAMLVLDARRASPDVQVFSAGGYLRGMTRASQQGRLNLLGSLIGLTERRKREDPT